MTTNIFYYNRIENYPVLLAVPENKEKYVYKVRKTNGFIFIQYVQMYSSY